MATVETRAGAASASSGRKEPSVLVVLVARDGSPWLRQSLRALANQTYPRIGVLAIDNGSADGSAELLEAALGPGRVVRSERDVGFSGAVGLALATETAQQADYVLLLHDDTVLDAGAVKALVEAAERVEGVGVVGPKVVDWDQHRVLLEIGLSTDRFGYPYSPLEEGEIDQGQYDRIREVLYVSSCALLVSRDVLGRVGPPDERLSPAHEDLDFCWRARMAGFRVLMTPKAIARHRAACARGERQGGADRMRYDRERAALASILKNYGLLSLLWILPLYFVQGLVRVATLALSRRFQDAYQIVAAWAWNVVHLPGTLRRRVRAQAVRAVPDRSVRRSMAPAWIRLRRWTQSAAEALLPAVVEGAEGEAPVRRRVHLLRFARAHSVATAWVLAVLVAAVAYRDLVSATSLTGGGLGSIPATPTGYFREFVSGLRNTGLGGSQAASPALGLLGVGSVLAFGSTLILEKALLLGLPAVAAVVCYRVVRTSTGQTFPSAVAAACYGVSSLTLWSISEGRIPFLVVVAGVPWLVTKLTLPFGRVLGTSRLRWVVGAGVGLAVLGSFFPGVVLSVGVVMVAAVVVPGPGGRRLGGVILCLLTVILAGVLIFPLAFEVLRGGASALTDHAGNPGSGALVRLSLGTAPGSWPTGFFLPIAAAIALVFVSRTAARPALRAVLWVLLSFYLAWMAAAGYLPAALSNAPAYEAVAAFGLCWLVGMGLADLVRGVSQATFGRRQVAVGAMAVVLVGGLGAQAVQAATGSWTVGGVGVVPPAYSLVQQPPPDYRVLWLGSLRGDAFPAPGGLPDGTVAAGPASIRYAVRDQTGASALDVGRPSAGPGYDTLERAMSEILVGEARHGGALLASLSIRFVVGGAGDIPPAALRRLARQVDLDQIPTQGLIIFRNDKAAPMAAVLHNAQWRRAAASGDPLDVQMLSDPEAVPLVPLSDEEFSGPATSDPALVLLAQQFDARWKLTSEGASLSPDRAFDWAVGFRTSPAQPAFRVAFGGQAPRTIEVGVLAVLWAAALWLTRRPMRSG